MIWLSWLLIELWVWFLQPSSTSFFHHTIFLTILDSLTTTMSASLTLTAAALVLGSTCTSSSWIFAYKLDHEQHHSFSYSLYGEDDRGENHILMCDLWLRIFYKWCKLILDEFPVKVWQIGQKIILMDVFTNLDSLILYYYPTFILACYAHLSILAAGVEISTFLSFQPKNCLRN